VRDENGEVFQALPRRLINRQGGGRRGGFKADPEKDHLFCRVFLCQFQRVQGRIDHPDIAALGFHR
jgi:hypothetical protein